VGTGRAGSGRFGSRAHQPANGRVTESLGMGPGVLLSALTAAEGVASVARGLMTFFSPKAGMRAE
jgi:hypothetical protein